MGINLEKQELCDLKIRTDEWTDFIKKCFEQPEKFIKKAKEKEKQKKRGFQNKLAEITKTYMFPIKISSFSAF